MSKKKKTKLKTSEFKLRDIHIALIVFFLFSLVVLTWFKKDYVLGSGDHFRMIDFGKYLRDLDSVWNGEWNTGDYEFSLSIHFPYSLIYFPLGLLGFSATLTEKIWLIISLFFPAFFMYLFLTEFWGGKIHNYIRIALALFYVFNPYCMMYPVGLSATKFPTYLVAPLLSFLLLKIFKSEEIAAKLRYSILFSFSTMLSAGSFVNIAEMAPLVIILTGIFSYCILASKKKQQNLLFIFGTFLFSILLNSWALYGSVLSFFIRRESFTTNLEAFTAASGTFLFDALRLLGFWAFNEKRGSVLMYPYSPFFYSFLGVLITYLVTFLAFSSLFILHYAKKDKAKLLTFLSLGIGGLFLVKGLNDPAGGWYRSLLENYPMFGVFREPYAKFGLITLFSYTVLITYVCGYADTFLKKKEPKKSSVIIAIGFSLLMFGVSYPLFTGAFINDFTYGKAKQSLIRVPQYWKEFRRYTENTNIRGRVLTMPHTWYYMKSFVWESGFVGRPYDIFIDANRVFRKEYYVRNPGDLIIKAIYNSVHLANSTPMEDEETANNNYTLFLNLTRLLNVTQILQMNDFDLLSSGEIFIPWSGEKMDQFYSSLDPYIVLEKSFGKFTLDYLMSIPHIRGGQNIYRDIDSASTDDYINELLDRDALTLYKVDSPYILGKVYVADTILEATDLPDMLNILTNPLYFSLKPLFIPSNAGPTEVQDNIDVTYKKISDSKYQVSLEGIPKKDFYLVFSESYDPGWELYKKCGWLRCTKKVDSHHLKANYYANGWVIDPNNTPSNFYIAHKSEFGLHALIVVSSVMAVIGIFVLFSADKVVEIIKSHKYD